MVDPLRSHRVSGRTRRQRAFTLVELLVVISIIGLLIAILLPAMNKARQAGRRIIDASQLRQWGQAISGYAADHDDAVLEIGSIFSDDAMIPFHLQLDEADGGDEPHGVFTAKRMNPYLLEPVDISTGRIEGVVICPFEDQELITRWNFDSVIATLPPGQAIIEAGYSYYAHMEQITLGDKFLTANHSAVEDLTGNVLTGTKIIMADTWDYAGSDGWWYNHGSNPLSTTGWSFWDGFMRDNNAGEGDFDVPPRVTGLHRLFGDASARWLDRQQIEGLDETIVTAIWKGGYLSFGGLGGSERMLYGSKTPTSAGGSGKDPPYYP